MGSRLVPVLLNGTAVIFSLELSRAALIPTSREHHQPAVNLQPGVTMAQGFSGHMSCPLTSPCLLHQEKMKAPPWPGLTSDTFSSEIAFPELLHRGVSLLSSRCTVIMLMSDISYAEDTYSLKILLHMKQIPCEELSSSSALCKSTAWRGAPQAPHCKLSSFCDMVDLSNYHLTSKVRLQESRDDAEGWKQRKRKYIRKPFGHIALTEASSAMQESWRLGGIA